MNSFDPRLHAIRPDIADVRLGKAAESARLVEGEVREVAAPLLSLYREPRFDARLDTQGLLGASLNLADDLHYRAWTLPEIRHAAPADAEAAFTVVPRASE